MPNKTVTVDQKDLVGPDLGDSVIATYDRAHPPYLGEQVDVECRYRVEEGELVLKRTGAVTNMNHEFTTCLVRLPERFPTYETLDKMAREWIGAPEDKRKTKAGT